MNVTPASPPKAPGRGFVLGELLVAALLLAVAISSLTALMYTVTNRPARRVSSAECADAAPKSAKCVGQKPQASSASSKLLVAGCATRSGGRVQACKDSVLLAEGDDPIVIRSRTDSASMALLPKKHPRKTLRPDLGFIR